MSSPAPFTFGDFTDATNQARRETPLVVTDGTTTSIVTGVELERDSDGALTDVKITTGPAV